MQTDYDTNLDENGLIKEYLRTNNEYFLKALFEKNIRSLYLFVSQKVANRVDVDEVVQETFIKVWQKLAKFDQNKRFKNWLLTIANNVIIDRWRIKKDESALNDEILVNESDDLNKIIDVNIDLGKIYSILDSLKDEQRLVVLMHYLDELSYKEIAEILNEPLNTIKSRASRAVEYIKTKMHQK